MTDKKWKIIGFTGSLQSNSFNRSALRAAGDLFPADVDFEIIEPMDLPFFNEDVETKGLPEAVTTFKRRLSEADAFLISTPEYNFSLPPSLKNALDWASRGDLLPMYGKPIAIMSASPSMMGGVRAQHHLRQVCVSLNLIPVNKPEVFIATAQNKFDEDGNLTDVSTREMIRQLIEALMKKLG